ncbi:hypothetical protein KSD_46180 [Ktedonobacter sp. SOSP1-85]|uniref:Uncharacterized protein n=1 Tax=Ktedonobacter robiniae TaxID=2778365 RepID=A0ABQ3UGA3_9CHLR|nr:MULTISPECIES: hypothetical protein [Ktedonobacter]GHO51742.1 hypothetical protein KSB_02170 [Ktedonobacter robiniae]GHO76847.1 hypothetical protein KSD_46180 [Ktedonobacter sp. SOSP1-85]
MTVNLKLLTAQTVVMCGFRSGPLSGDEPNRKTWDKVFENRGLLAWFDKSDPPSQHGVEVSIG